MRWFPVAFLANGVLKVKHGGIELTTPVLCVHMRHGTTSALGSLVKKQTYHGHVKRSNGLEKVIMEGRMDGSKARGRQRTQWHNSIRSWTEMGARVLGDLAMDRDAFRHSAINALRAYDT